MWTISIYFYGMKVALLGSTGLVGKNVLKILARLDQVESVYCPVRTVPDFQELKIFQGYSKIRFEQINFRQILDKTKFPNGSGEETEKIKQNFLNCEAVVCCLGTTLKQAGSKKAQEKVDLCLPLTLAAIAKKQSVRHFLCVSAMGANTSSPFFYNRLKGMLEEGLTMVNFDGLTLVRPSLLLGRHKDKRIGEEFLQKIFGKHPELVPARFRPVHAETVAAHLCASLLKPPFEHICASDGVKGKRIVYNRILAQTKVEEFV